MKKTNKPSEGGNPKFVDELLNKGMVVISASSADSLSAMLADIPSDVKYYTGAVGKNPETGKFTLQINKI